MYSWCTPYGDSHPTLQTFTPLALRSVEQADPAIIETLKAQTDLVGMPRIGSDDNWAFPSVQCNIAAAKVSESSELVSCSTHFIELIMRKGRS